MDKVPAVQAWRPEFEFPEFILKSQAGTEAAAGIPNMGGKGRGFLHQAG